MALKRVCKDILVVLDFNYHIAQSPFVISVRLPGRALTTPGHLWAVALRWSLAMATCAPGSAQPLRCAPPAAACAQLSCSQLRIFHLILLLINGETQVQQLPCKLRLASEL